MSNYHLESTSKLSAKGDDIVLRETKTTRLIFRPLVIDNPNDPDASVKGWFVFQKKKSADKWQDHNNFPLSKLKSGEWVKLELKSSEVKLLLDNFQILKSFYEKHGIVWGDVQFQITENNVSSVINQLSRLENKDLIISELEKLKPENISSLYDSLLLGLQAHKRKQAIETFETMLSDDAVESTWQKWFQDNDWVLGTEFVEVLEERAIDTNNITDYLMKAYDGFLDIVEIKRPEGALKFWASNKDHDNVIPSSDLIKAIAQAAKYIYEVERESNSVKFLERVNKVKTIKPRCILIFGRSNNWNDEEAEAYRILNSSYHNLTIMTYDHVLLRAKRILGLDQEVEPNADFVDGEDIPF